MMGLPKRPVIKAAAIGAPMSKSLVLKMKLDDALLIGPFRIELMETWRGRIMVRVEAPDQPVALVSGGKVKVGAHHELAEQDDT
jgi:hypothetical protein